MYNRRCPHADENRRPGLELIQLRGHAHRYLSDGRSSDSSAMKAMKQARGDADLAKVKMLEWWWSSRRGVNVWTCGMHARG
nr:hypothetical protein CFP56_36489 [Quercus suber]